jgi:hypothetical protein
MVAAIAKFLIMATDSGGTPTAVLRERVPGWYPDAANPNVQRFWDGTRWSAQRVWNVRGWHESRVTLRPDQARAKKRSGRKRRP